jgi:hypothetical protein
MAGKVLQAGCIYVPEFILGRQIITSRRDCFAPANVLSDVPIRLQEYLYIFLKLPPDLSKDSVQHRKSGIV